MICIERRIAKGSYEISLSMFTSFPQKNQNQVVHLAPSYSQSNGLHTELFCPIRNSGQTTWVPYIEPTGTQFGSKLGTIRTTLGSTTIVVSIMCTSLRVLRRARPWRRARDKSLGYSILTTEYGCVAVASLKRTCEMKQVAIEE